MIVIKRPFLGIMAAVLLGEVIATLDIGLYALIIFVLALVIWMIFKGITTKKGLVVVLFCFTILGYLATYNGIIVRNTVWREKPNSNVFLLSVGKINESTSGYNIVLEKDNVKYLLRSKEKPVYKIGQELRIKGRIKQFDEARNAGNFDMKEYYMSQGIYALIEGDSIKMRDDSYDALRQFLYETREHIKALLKRICNGEFLGKGSVNEEKNSIYQAMLLGDKSEIDPDIKDLYSSAGIAHILAISGLHISFIGMFLYKLLRRKAGFAVSASCSFAIVVLFSIMSGMGIATIRALVMFGLKLMGEVLGRVYDSLTAMCVAGTLLVLDNPFVVYNQGFVLSFVAIYAIGYIWPKVVAILGFDKKEELKHIVVKSFLFSLNVTIYMAPLMVFYYYFIPSYSTLLNIIVVPLMGIVIGAAVTSIVVGWSSLFTIINCLGIGNAMLGLSSLVVYPSSLILELYQWLCRLSANWPGANIIVGKISIYHLLGYYLIVSVTVYLLENVSIKREHMKKVKRKQYGEDGKSIEMIIKEKKQDKKDKKKIILVWIVICFVLYISLYAQNIVGEWVKEPLDATFIDVGQGDGIYMDVKGDNVCVDGGSTTVKSVGKYRIVPFLKAKGVGQIDYQFVTHGDEDHLNGIREILENDYLTIKNLIIPKLDEKDKTLEELKVLAFRRGTEVFEIKRGDEIDIKGVKIRCLHPYNNMMVEDKNDGSIVLSVEYEGFSMLLTGDLTSEMETDILKEIRKPYTVLKVGHHGSKYSSSELFLEKIMPKLSVISVGKGNKYGHPTPEVLARLKSIESLTIRTDESGGISLATDGNKVKWEQTIIVKE